MIISYPQPRADGCVTKMPTHRSTHANVIDIYSRQRDEANLPTPPNTTPTNPIQTGNVGDQAKGEREIPQKTPHWRKLLLWILWGSMGDSRTILSRKEYMEDSLAAEQRLQRMGGIGTKWSKWRWVLLEISFIDPSHLLIFLIWDNRGWPP